ncbi:mutS protein homolog 5-like [Uranotaenia lowii]|uniref:mutS protein homolog 5-like n=1 Tax=Uranotaenia lowii TaxID=190385 RepID=UPI002478FFA7|nr:mutS protein homolog 5-like [Uranotaenia lowii]XP_055610337.1 mutS protein homolog 5-like [Uranotaenia lowii]
MASPQQHDNNPDPTGTILSICWSSGEFSGCYYDLDQAELYAVQQAPDAEPQYAQARNLIRQCNPLFTLVSGSSKFTSEASELLGLSGDTPLQRIGSGKLESWEKARVCDFGPKALQTSVAKVMSLNLPGLPAEASTAERKFFLESVIPFSQELLVHSIGCMLTLLGLILPEQAGTLITKINIVAPESLLIVDKFTYEALQLFDSQLHPSGFKFNMESNSRSLFNLYNRCCSHLGKRKLVNIMQQPSRDLEELNRRLETVQWLSDPLNKTTVEEMRKYLRNVTQVWCQYRKICRKNSDISVWKSFKKNIYYAYLLCKLCLGAQNSSLQGTPIGDLAGYVAESDGPLKRLLYTLDKVIDLERVEISGKISFKDGLDQELDQLRINFDDVGSKLLETSRLDIESISMDIEDLLVAFLPSYGFVFCANDFEDLHDSNVFERSAMTLVLRTENTVYFQNELCKELNVEFSTLMAGINERENGILENLIVFINEIMPQIGDIFKIVAKLDVLMAFASVAESQVYRRPTLSSDKVLHIRKGRHPLLERLKTYHPNDTEMGSAFDCLLKIYSSPETTGKTVYLKEVAIICYLAHIGSFVPAESAHIGILDCIYTRLDFPESILNEKSSFMSELYQMSTILMNTSSKSLVIIDEFGKGTTFCEGKALLIASIEYLAEKSENAPLTLVATQFEPISSFLKETQFLKFTTVERPVPSPAKSPSTQTDHGQQSQQMVFKTVTQTMTLALVKKFLASESIDPDAIWELYRNVPITQPPVV